MEGAVRKSRSDLTLDSTILPVPVYSTEGSLGRREAGVPVVLVVVVVVP